MVSFCERKQKVTEVFPISLGCCRLLCFLSPRLTPVYLLFGKSFDDLVSSEH